MATLREYIAEQINTDGLNLRQRRQRLIDLRDDLATRFVAAGDPDSDYADEDAAVAYGKILAAVNRKILLSGYGEPLLYKLLDFLEEANQNSSNQREVASHYGAILWSNFYLSSHDCDQFFREAEAVLADQDPEKQTGPITGGLPTSTNDDPTCALQKSSILDSIYQSPGGVLSNYNDFLESLRRIMLTVRSRKDYWCAKAPLPIPPLPFEDPVELKEEVCCRRYTAALANLETILNNAVAAQATVVKDLQDALAALDCTAEDWETKMATVQTKITAVADSLVAQSTLYRQWDAQLDEINADCACPGDIKPNPNNPGIINIDGLMPGVGSEAIGRGRLNIKDFEPDFRE